MKKLFIAATVATSILASNAFAKTEGNYVGADLLIGKFSDDLGTGKKDSIDIGLGVNYKHAFNFDGFFVAPGVYFNYQNASVDSGSNSTEADYSYGAGIDFGIDVTDSLATFLSLGFRENRISGVDNLVNYATTEELFVYGVGARYALSEELDFVAEYQYGDYKGDIDSTFNDHLLKLGVAYNF